MWPEYQKEKKVENKYLMWLCWKFSKINDTHQITDAGSSKGTMVDNYQKNVYLDIP